MHPGPVLFFPLFDRQNLAAKVRELQKFLLNFLQPFLPLPVRDLGLGRMSAPKPVLLIQLLNLGNLRPQTPDLIPQNLKMIHTLLG